MIVWWDTHEDQYVHDDQDYQDVHDDLDDHDDHDYQVIEFAWDTISAFDIDEEGMNFSFQYRCPHLSSVAGQHLKSDFTGGQANRTEQSESILISLSFCMKLLKR